MAAVAQHRPSTLARTAVLASADVSFRQRLRDALTELRWQVREAAGGAETLACLDTSPAEAVVVDSWLPDLEIREFIAEFERTHPGVDLLLADASSPAGSWRSPRHNEVLYALRRAQSHDGASWNPGPRSISPGHDSTAAPAGNRAEEQPILRTVLPSSHPERSASARPAESGGLPEFVGSDPGLLEVSRRIRLVAARATPVLVEGPTGSGKELVARALHRLSPRSAHRFVALNCAAIPEALLEAELFGHTRGAFTGAVQGRTGRIEAAHGGTLFLDEIGEMPFALQAKLLRFLETGELQRVGDNEPVRVDVRIIAATHRPLGALAAKGGFRADLYYRLAVFFIRTPPLAGRTADIEALTLHLLEKMAQKSPAKDISPAALAALRAHPWPGNVRELEHVLERAWILAEDRPRIDRQEIEFYEPE
jgi:DNA-binding NtrC family response regulator